MADYLSQAVLVGYIGGVAIVLIIGQLGKLTGIPSADGNALQEMWGYLTHLDDGELGDGGWSAWARW